MTKELETVATMLFTCESKQKISSVMQELKKMQKKSSNKEIKQSKTQEQE